MNKMKTILCDNGLCKCSKDDSIDKKYRLPYCSGFIRPTDKIQENDNKLMSSGYHVPLCRAIDLAGEYGKLIENQLKNNLLKVILSKNYSMII